MGDEHSGNGQVAQQLIELAAQALAQLRIKGSQGLVEQQYPRLWGQGAGQGNPLALAAGQLVNGAAAMILQADQLEQFGAASIALRPCHTADLQAVDDVAGHI